MSKRAHLVCLLFGCLLWGCQSGDQRWAERVSDVNLELDALQPADTQARKANLLSELKELFKQAPQTEDPRIVWVREDLCARIAELELAQDHAKAALHWLGVGLELGHAPSVARANLLLIKAELLLRQNKKEESTEVLHQALIINQELMEEALGSEDGE